MRTSVEQPAQLIYINHRSYYLSWIEYKKELSVIKQAEVVFFFFFFAYLAPQGHAKLNQPQLTQVEKQNKTKACTDHTRSVARMFSLDLSRSIPRMDFLRKQQRVKTCSSA